MLKCGFYESDVTPAMGMNLPGYFRERPATGVKDRIYVCAACFEDGNGGTAVTISCDAEELPEATCTRARGRIASRLEIPEDTILICATHIHTGGPTWACRYYDADNDYLRFLEDRIVDTALLAHARRQEVTIGFATGTEDKISYCRDYLQPDGTVKTFLFGNGARHYAPIDPSVGVLRIDRPDGTPFGVLVNFACHCDCVGGTEISADFPGELRAALRKYYGEDFHTVFINGYCGDINHVSPDGFHEFPEHYRRMGRMLAGDVIRTRELATEKKTDAAVDGILSWHDIPVRQVTPEMLARAEEEVESTDRSKTTVHTASDLALEIIRVAKAGKKVERVPLQVLTIGDVAFYAMPGEIFTAFGLALKKDSPFPHQMTANLANGGFGYIPTEDLFGTDIYEARLGISGTLVPTAGDQMVKILRGMAEELKERQ